MTPDFAVYIGRFQPYHNGHHAVLLKALRTAPQVVIVLGSANTPRDPRNPFTTSEREGMIRGSLAPDHNARLRFVTIEDHPMDNLAWAADVDRAVAAVTHHSKNIALLAPEKDGTSFYLHLFPQWHFEGVTLGDEPTSSTDIRDDYLRESKGALVNLRNIFERFPLPKGSKDFLWNFHGDAEYLALKLERRFLDKYDAMWASAPYPPVFVTVDAFLRHRGKIGLIQRKNCPGVGLWAAAGGYLNYKDQNGRWVQESIKNATRRELKEETGFDLSAEEFDNLSTATMVFDTPGRSLRGRIITHATLIDLPSGMEQPKLVAADDAMDARFWDPADIKLSMMFEDHGHMLKALTSSQ